MTTETKPSVCPDTNVGEEHLFDITTPVDPDDFKILCVCGKFQIVMDELFQFHVKQVND